MKTYLYLESSLPRPYGFSAHRLSGDHTALELLVIAYVPVKIPVL